MDDQKLRELCVSFAMSILLLKAKKGIDVSITPVDMADHIFQYIKTGEKDERLVRY